MLLLFITQLTVLSVDPNPMKRTSIYYTNKYALIEALRELPELNTDNLVEKNLNDLQERHIQELNNLAKQITSEKSSQIVKEKLLHYGLKTDDESLY